LATIHHGSRRIRTERKGGYMGKTNQVALVIIFSALLLPFQNAAQAQQSPNNLQRSVQIYQYKTVTDSGADRGEVIYYYKCWMCHNDYTRASGTAAPSLKEVFKRAKLVSGEAVNDDTVSKQIKNGSAAMPAFRNTLTDADIADLLKYLRDKCCYQEE